MFASPFTDTRPGLGLWARLATFILFGISTLTAQTGETNPEASPTEVETTATGTLTGRIVDQETGTAITNATVLVDNDESLIGISDSSGEYLILNVPAGTRSLVATKADYRTSRIENVQVIADQENVQNIPMQTLPTEATEEQVAQLEDVVFEAAQVDQVLANLELRLDADTFVNTLSAEDFSRFAATDVADAVRRVAGVNVVEGQFAIIRGLEDRYSSTYYNGAIIPSPDPDSQSVQLDLFPSEIVSNLIVSKTFAPNLPSNSAGGNINIITNEFPEETSVTFKAGIGYNDNAFEEFRFLQDGRAAGRPEGDHIELIEHDLSVSGAGTLEWEQIGGRPIRFKFIASRESDFETDIGSQQSLAADPATITELEFLTPPQTNVTESGDLVDGDLSIGFGLFDLSQSQATRRSTFYVGLGTDLDLEGNHRIDGSFFFTRVREEVVQIRDNGRDPNATFAPFATFDQLQQPGVFMGFAAGSSRRPAPDSAPNEDPFGIGSGGIPEAFFYAPFGIAQSFETERELRILQLNGAHDFEFADGLSLSWTGNDVKTTQDEESNRLNFIFDPADNTFNPIDDIPGFAANPRVLEPEEFVGGAEVATISDGEGFVGFNENSIEETGNFASAEVEYVRAISDWLEGTGRIHFFLEDSSREVAASAIDVAAAGGNSAARAPTLDELSQIVIPEQTLDEAIRVSESDNSREVAAIGLFAKAGLFEKVDVSGGIRIEELTITSRNNPFFDPNDTDDPDPFGDGGDVGLFPNKSILGALAGIPFDTTGTPLLPSEIPAFQDAADGQIEETLFLPAVSLTARPFEGWSVRLAYAETVARPSFRELGYYTSAEPASTQLVVGNPTLQLSDVTNYDARIEYVTEEGDLAAVSVFYKEIENPIEQVFIFDQINAGAGTQFRSFENNPNTADLTGLEVEARKNLGFTRVPFAEFFTLGGNLTLIDASVARTDDFVEASRFLFAEQGNDVDPDAFPTLPRERRLFAQPEWIANADIQFYHEDWGTRVTLSVFAISDILETAGSFDFGLGTDPNNIGSGDIESYTPDLFVKEFYQLDLVISQAWGNWTFGFSVKNITDTERGLFYDEEVTNGADERSFKVGRDYSLSASYTF